MKHFASIDDANVTEALVAGCVGVLPTDTLYGLVCKASNQASVARLYKLKHREHKPGTIIAASTGQLAELGLKARYLKAVEDFWPASLSAVIPCGPELNYLHQGKFGLAVRVPKDKAITKLLTQTGPLLTSSANQPGELPASTIAEAEAYFGQAVDFYTDGGNLAGREASTLVRVVDDALEILRQGSVKIDEKYLA